MSDRTVHGSATGVVEARTQQFGRKARGMIHEVSQVSQLSHFKAGWTKQRKINVKFMMRTVPEQQYRSIAVRSGLL